MNMADFGNITAAPSPGSAPRELSPLARAIAAEPVAQAISPVVLIGAVRLAEFIGIVLIGAIAYAALVRDPDLDWAYAVAILLVSSAAVLAFQAFEIYSVAAFRTHVHQLTRLALAWTLVFLVAFAISFFGKLDGTFSRIWAASWFSAGLAALFVGRLALTALVRRWARDGRLVRRVVIVGGGREGESLLQALEQRSRFRRAHLRRVRRSQPATARRAIVAGVPKLGTVEDLIQFTRLTRVDLVLVSMPLTAEERVLQMVRKLWVLPVDVRLAAHMNRLRFRPRAYSYIGNVPVLDIFDKPIADWNMVMKTLFDRVAGALILARAVAGDGGGRDRHQARQPGPGVVPPAPPRLQQRGHRGPQIPLALSRARRSQCAARRDQGRLRASPGSAASSARPRSTNCRSSSTCCAASCRWSARAPTRSRRRPRTGCGRKWSTAISPATACARASPAGPRSTAGAASSTRRRSCRTASSTTSTTSRTGRCCSTSTSCCARPFALMKIRERLLTALALDTGEARARPALAGLSAACCGWSAFSGGFVVIEPAPYEFVVALATLVFVATGLPLRPAHLPLMFLLIAYNIGYLIGVVPVLSDEGTATWTAVSCFMSVTTLFFALALGEDTERRLDMLLKGYLAVAVVVSIFGIVTYFHLLPGSDTFMFARTLAGDLQGPERAWRVPGAARTCSPCSAR